MRAVRVSHLFKPYPEYPPGASNDLARAVMRLWWQLTRARPTIDKTAQWACATRDSAGATSTTRPMAHAVASTAAASAQANGGIAAASTAAAGRAASFAVVKRVRAAIVKVKIRQRQGTKIWLSEEMLTWPVLSFMFFLRLVQSSLDIELDMELPNGQPGSRSKKPVAIGL